MTLNKKFNINLVIPTYKRYNLASKLIENILLSLPKDDYPNIVISISENGSNKLEKYKYLDNRIRYRYSRKVVSMSRNIANALKEINYGYVWIISDDDFIQEKEFLNSINLMQKLDNELITFTFSPKSNIELKRKLVNTFIEESLTKFNIPYTLLSSVAINIRSNEIKNQCIKKLEISDNTFAQNYILLEVLTKGISIYNSNLIPFIYNDKPHSRWSGAKGVLDTIVILELYYKKLDLKFNYHSTLEIIFIRNLLDNLRISFLTDSYESRFTESELQKYFLLAKNYLILKKYKFYIEIIIQIYNLKIDFIFKYFFRFLKFVRGFFLSLIS